MELIETIFLSPYAALAFSFKWLFSAVFWFGVGYSIYTIATRYQFGYELRNPLKKKTK